MCWSLGLLPAHPSWMFTLTAVQHFALILNSSINFVVYCAMGTKCATLNSPLSTEHANILSKGRKDKMQCRRKILFKNILCKMPKYSSESTAFYSIANCNLFDPRELKRSSKKIFKIERKLGQQFLQGFTYKYKFSFLRSQGPYPIQ